MRLRPKTPWAFSSHRLLATVSDVLLSNDVFYNQAKAIASLLCPYLRGRSPKTPYRCVIETEAEVREVYNTRKIFCGRKGIFQTKREFIAQSMLLSEPDFVSSAGSIELRHVLPDGSEAYWNGKGAKKNFSSAAVAESGRMFGTHSGGDALAQVDISRVWSEISPLLDQKS
jgi:hypothetical protein